MIRAIHGGFRIPAGEFLHAVLLGLTSGDYQWRSVTGPKKTRGTYRFAAGSVFMPKEPITVPRPQPAEPNNINDPQPYIDPVESPPGDPQEDRPLHDPTVPGEDKPRM